ncbi:MAG TPA: hypothetical protein PLF32_03670 [Bacteroidales bacterium]|jgi:hypothetical protein|nr:hypothetical protein [Bacteroidales bacterium]HOR81732.1 hypothetical protein [Bacteroidales bacterium]HPJ91201.1 hypothetical protein [Bacteroidales bacterium]HQB20026.1 hypothetical protein [Bacteroidales bacterium]
MKNKHNILLFCMYALLFTSCKNRSNQENFKGNNINFNTTENINCNEINDSSALKGNIDTITIPTYYDFIGDREIKEMIRIDKKNKIMDLDSAKIFYGNAFPYAKDSIEIWWNNSK